MNILRQMIRPVVRRLAYMAGAYAATLGATPGDVTNIEAAVTAVAMILADMGATAYMQRKR